VTTSAPPTPSLRNILLGLLSALAFVVLLLSAPSAVKWLGAPFLVLPRALGLIGSYGPHEIVEIPLGSPPTAVTFPHGETYVVYVSELRLLEASDTIAASGAPPWLVIQRVDSGRPVPVEPIDRGLIPFDEARVAGRPVYRFTIDEAGAFAFSHPRSLTSIYFVPDRISGKEGLLTGTTLAQLALLSIPIWLRFGPSWLERRRSWRAHQQERRAATERVRRGQAAQRANDPAIDRSKRRF
jgi:hypothetical protein